MLPLSRVLTSVAPFFRGCARAWVRLLSRAVSRSPEGFVSRTVSRGASSVAVARRAWRGSVRLRVVTITLVTSGVLVATFGVLVGNMITNGLVAAKTESARKQVEVNSVYALEQLSVISNDQDPLGDNNIFTVISALANRDQGSGIDVAIVPAEPASRLRSQSYPHERAYAQVPQAFKAAVEKEGFVDQRLTLDLGGGGGPRLYLVFGRQLTHSWGALQLYYFYPLDDEINSASLVRNTLAVTGTTLVIMMVLIAALVTRMVVRPVQVAARTARRLSAGLLDQRMQVRGEDELAALATSFNQMAENLQRHILRLEEMSRLQRRFTSDVSHELRTPLTTIRMAADLIFTERESFDPPMARSAELLHAELDRFETLLADLLEISRFDAGFAVLDAEPVDLVPIVRLVAERLSRVAERAKVRIELDVPDEPVVAEVDPRRVERVLRNLIGNAVEHGEGEPVQVRLAVGKGAVAVTVRDRGIGLKPGEDRLVFNRFWRADPSRARQTGGTGLGLSISLEDARLHGGWLEAWGAPGQGAQFRLTLPCRAGDRLAGAPLRLIPADALVALPATPRSAGKLPVAPQAPETVAAQPVAAQTVAAAESSAVPSGGVGGGAAGRGDDG